MASLADFYSPQASPIGPLANNAMTGADAGTDAGLQQTRLLRSYATRSLPDLTNTYAARGTFYGGQVGVAADRLKEDTANQYGDIQRNLDRTLANLRRSGILAATGVQL